MEPLGIVDGVCELGITLPQVLEQLRIPEDLQPDHLRVVLADLLLLLLLARILLCLLLLLGARGGGARGGSGRPARVYYNHVIVFEPIAGERAGGVRE